MKAFLTMTLARILAAFGSEVLPAYRLKDMDVFGRLGVADWKLRNEHGPPSRQRHNPGIDRSNHFGWVLEGRAIQESWIRPRP